MKNSVEKCLDQMFDYKKFQSAIFGEVVIWNEWEEATYDKIKKIKAIPRLYSKYLMMLEMKLSDKKYESELTTFIDKMLVFVTLLISIAGLYISGFIGSQNLLGQFWTNLSATDSALKQEFIQNFIQTYNSIWKMTGLVAAGCFIFFLVIYILNTFFHRIDKYIKKCWETRRMFYKHIYNMMTEETLDI